MIRSLVLVFFISLVWGLPAHAQDMTRQELIAHMTPYFNEIVDSIYLAEGGVKAKKPFGILSVPCSGYEDCRKVCFNTVRNNYLRWVDAGRQGEFLDFLASRYAPLGAANDPYNLNVNWQRNVTKLTNKRGTVAVSAVRG